MNDYHIERRGDYVAIRKLKSITTTGEKLYEDVAVLPPARAEAFGRDIAREAQAILDEQQQTLEEATSK